MKKLLFLLVTMMVLLIGCSNGSDLQEYEHSSLKDDLKGEPFQAKLPTKLPFEVELATFTPAPTEEQKESIQTFQFDGINGELLDMKAFKNEVDYGEIDKEEVTIGGETGYYFENENDAKILIWINEGMNYELATMEKSITKNDLVEVAKSIK
ncbi:DUF4367 domain-containing protein [Bacillus spongiae]|uniref:DUF4367 domain-containing protein n=1 Tax=Bacillus spongiae TaxID=2683610 RepID=A0ABU8HFP8_9BACI